MTDTAGDGTSTYITLAEAAKLAGYTNPTTLYSAARAGRLRTHRLGPRALVTTCEWLDAYLQGVRAGEYRRGSPKSTPRADTE